MIEVGTITHKVLNLAAEPIVSEYQGLAPIIKDIECVCVCVARIDDVEANEGGYHDV